MILILMRLYRAWHRRIQPTATGESDGRLSTSPPVTRASAASRGRLALVGHQVRYDLLASIRNPRARFFTFFFPILLLVVFAGVFGHDTAIVDGIKVPRSRFYVSGILAMSIITASYGNLVVSIATARETGVLKRRRATPVPPGMLVLGQVASTLAITAVMGTILLAIARVAYDVGMSPGALAAIACATVIGTFTFACLGYLVSGMIGSLEAAQPIVQATMMPLYFISGVWIPTDQLGGGLRTLASVFPVEHLAAALHLASVRGPFTSAVSPTDLLVLAGWALAAALLAARRFSWLPNAATA